MSTLSGMHQQAAHLEADKKASMQVSAEGETMSKKEKHRL
jgi:hypothetical protein